MATLISIQNRSVIVNGEEEIQCFSNETALHEHFLVKSALGILYGLVFMTAVCGNTLVIYVVATNKNMQSVTNIFITNLAVSDILVNFTSLWLTPVYSYLGRWVWGSVMCHLVPLFQGMSTFISALTLMAIAIDRYIAILYPFRTRTSLMVCCIVVVNIWLVGLLLVMPLAVQMNLRYYEECDLYICREEWVSYPDMRVVYGFVVLSLQFGVPFIVIAFCYIRIWLHLMYRRSMVVTTARSASDERRRRRLLKMLVAMVVIYVLAWLPVNSLNVLRDATNVDYQEYFVILFLFAHLSSMSATCWNPIVYAWMNDNFRREFKAVLPCFQNTERFQERSQSVTGYAGGPRRSIVTTTVGNSDYSTTTRTRRSSVAISADSSNGNSPRSKNNSFKFHWAGIASKKDEDNQSMQIQQRYPTQKANSEISLRALRLGNGGSTVLSVPSYSQRSKSACKLMARKPTGKRRKQQSDREMTQSSRTNVTNGAVNNLDELDNELSIDHKLLKDQNNLRDTYLKNRRIENTALIVTQTNL